MDDLGANIVIGHTTRYELKAFDADGALVQVIRREHAPLSPTPRDVEAYIAEQLVWNAPYQSPAESAQTRRRYEAVPVAAHFPAFMSVRSDAVGHLWVQEYEFLEQERPPQVWTVFDPDGGVLGFVEMPEGLHVYEIGRDYILGRTMDRQLGVESIQVWPLHR